MNGKCLSNNISYTTTLTSSNKKYEARTHKEICETIFKLRYANHERSFNLENYRKNTKFSIEYWKPKSKKRNPKHH